MIFNNLSQSHLELVREYRENFLDMNYKKMITCATSKKELYYIYVIENLVTHKLYVGKNK